MGTLTDRVALVTGATSGIGRAVAEAFAGQGANVVGVGRNGATGVEMERALRGAGGRFRFVSCDVGREEEVDALFAGVRADAGRLDLAVNCAGVEHTASLAECDADAYDRVFGTNVRGLFLCLRAEIRSMGESGGGAIVNVGSIAGRRVFRRNGLYGASKAAVTMLTRTCALECGGLGIRVNEVAPGPTATPMLGRYLDGLPAAEAAALRDKMSAATPLGAISTATDVARAIVFLCSDEAGQITGATLTVDGGFVLA